MGYFVPLLFLAVVAAASADTAPLALALPPSATIVEVQQPAHAAIIAELGQPAPVVRPRRDPQFGGSGSSASSQSGSFGFGPFQGTFASSQASSNAAGGGFGGPGFGGGYGGRPGYGHGRPGYGHGGGHYHGHGGGHHHGHGGHHHGGGFHRRGFF